MVGEHGFVTLPGEPQQSSICGDDLCHNNDELDEEAEEVEEMVLLT